MPGRLIGGWLVCYADPSTFHRLWNTIDTSIVPYNLLKSPSPTRPRLKEPLGVIPQPSLKRIPPRLRLDPPPIILSEISIIHEQWPVHIWKKTLVDILLDQVVHAHIEVLVCLVDLLIVHRGGVGEVKFDEDVVRVCWDVEEVLFLLGDSGGSVDVVSYAAAFLGFFGECLWHWLEGDGA